MEIKKFECDSYVVVRYDGAKYTIMTSFCRTFEDAVFDFFDGIMSDFSNTQKTYDTLLEYGKIKSERYEGVEYYVWRIDEYESKMTYIYKNRQKTDEFPIESEQKTFDEGLYAIALLGEDDYSPFYGDCTTTNVDEALDIASNKIEDMVWHTEKEKIINKLDSNQWYECLRNVWTCTSAYFGLSNFQFGDIYGVQIIRITKITQPK